MVLGGRFVAGMGIGMLAMLAPLYQAEVRHFEFYFDPIQDSQTFEYGFRSLTLQFVVGSQRYNSSCVRVSFILLNLVLTVSQL